MSRITRKKWKRAKYPAEVDIRYVDFVNDMAPGDTIEAVSGVVCISGDIDIDSSGAQNTTVVYAVLSGGTVNSVIEFTVTTDGGYTLVAQVVQDVVSD